jgi:hypothetical protein
MAKLGIPLLPIVIGQRVFTTIEELADDLFSPEGVCVDRMIENLAELELRGENKHKIESLKKGIAALKTLIESYPESKQEFKKQVGDVYIKRQHNE